MSITDLNVPATLEQVLEEKEIVDGVVQLAPTIVNLASGRQVLAIMGGWDYRTVFVLALPIWSGDADRDVWTGYNLTTGGPVRSAFFAAAPYIVAVIMG